MANGKITYTSQEQNYEEILLQAVAVIDNARTALAKQVTTIATSTYWGIGKLLYDRKLESKHGSSIVKQLSADLKQKYPNMGLSTRNLWYMKSFYERYKDCDEKVQRSVAVLPWSSNMLIISKNLTDEQTIFYAQETIRKGWNRDLLLNAIKMKMHEKALDVVYRSKTVELIQIEKGELYVQSPPTSMTCCCRNSTSIPCRTTMR